MPLYDFKCTKCSHLEEDLQLSFEDDLTTVKCPECGELMQNMSFGGLGTVFRGSTWFDKNLKVKNQKLKKSENLKKKQKDEHAPLNLVPNIGGHECDSFSEAAKLAKEAGLDSSKYEKYAKEEKKRGRYEKPY